EGRSRYHALTRQRPLSSGVRPAWERRTNLFHCVRFFLALLRFALVVSCGLARLACCSSSPSRCSCSVLFSCSFRSSSQRIRHGSHRWLLVFRHWSLWSSVHPCCGLNNGRVQA